MPILDLGAKVAGIGDLPAKVRAFLDTLGIRTWITLGLHKLAQPVFVAANRFRLGKQPLTQPITLNKN